MNFTLKPLNDKLFADFSKLVFDQSGIYLKSEKKELLNARLGKRLRKCGFDSFEAYYNHVVNDTSGEEIIQLLDSVSTNFTSFFREKAHFDYLTATVLPELLKSAAETRKLSFWSAAGSSGEEPYTLAIVINDFFAKNPGWNCSVLATDLSTRVLNIARNGVYDMNRVASLPPEVLKKNFMKGTGKGSGYAKVKDHIRNMVTFQRFNLMHRFTWPEPFQVIFCRNVMIYFNKKTQEELVAKFYNCLEPNGYLFIGHSESLSSIKHSFTRVAPTVYRK
jgi:chemotaxis protein methyltransferase CheR